MLRKTFEITFVDRILGTEPSNPDIYRDYILSKAPDPFAAAKELDFLPPEDTDEDGAPMRTGITVFHRDADGNPALHMRHIKGYFKEACGALRMAAGKDPETGKRALKNESSKLTMYKSRIDSLIFVLPDYPKLILPEGMGITREQRPLLASTPQGPRSALACSECAPEGTKVRFTVTMLNDDLYPALIEWLDYGSFKGIGCWRNSGCGRFVYEEV